MRTADSAGDGGACTERRLVGLHGPADLSIININGLFTFHQERTDAEPRPDLTGSSVLRPNEYPNELTSRKKSILGKNSNGIDEEDRD